MIRLVPFVLFALAAEAAAQPGVTPYARDLDTPALPAPPTPSPPPPRDTGFIGGGLLLGADHFLNAALVAEGGLHLGGTPLWVRGLLAKGDSFDFEGGGGLTRGMIGIELRGCSRPSFCGFAAVDAGYQTQTWNGQDPDDMVEHHDGLLIGPRIGLDAGGDKLRVRFAFEATRYHHHEEINGTSSTGWQGGGGFTLTVVYPM